VKDLFDRPVLWGATVADDATEVATAEIGGIAPQAAAKMPSVAPVASVAEKALEAGRAIAEKVARTRLKNRAVAGVAGVAETEGERLERLLSQPTVAARATDAATGDPTVPCGVDADLQAPVAGVATVAMWRDKVDRLRRVQVAPRPHHTSWRTLYQDMTVFMGIWAEDAARLGWDTLDVFGVNADPAHSRYDRVGLLILLGGRPIQCLDADCAYIGKDHQPTVYRRSLRAPGAVPVWQWVEGCPQ
jgi:hypothetical protein